MAEQKTTPDAPAHTPGASGGEEQVEDGAEPEREDGARVARDSTGINPEERGPIDPKMPDMPPA